MNTALIAAHAAAGPAPGGLLHEPQHPRQIAGQGTPDAAWQAWEGLRLMPSIAAHELVAPGQRAIIVAPHPDDEVLACGGLLQLLAAQGTRTVIIAATDGDASHPGSQRYTPAQLARLRARETEAALRALLGQDPLAATHAAPPLPRQSPSPLPQIIRARLPDGDVTGQASVLHTLLGQLLRPDDVLFTTWRQDGHPDHEACGHAAAMAARLCGARLVELPVWTWHWAEPGDRRVPWHRARRLALDAATLQRKHDAIACYTTQLEPDPTTGQPAILPPHVLARLTHPYEICFL
ncbi:PIG-L deacetylase family protein [Duganella sp. Leaf126]|uniref:PIG-L deacetylase family protein n=1 Tax=Duganella sp. Leaf126 TaxID=1736266 RepID=UPI0009EC5721|nr:PIG-L family deacetylase [Duganella sp. Leaf126]